MKVILLKDLGKLGKLGKEVEVKDGYARNYLIPQGLALVATSKNSKRLEEIKKKKAKILETEKDIALKLKEKIEDISLTIATEAKDDESLYGAIGEVQILKSLKVEGMELEKGKIILDEPIRKLGVYSLKISVHSDVECTLRLWVVKK